MFITYFGWTAIRNWSLDLPCLSLAWLGMARPDFDSMKLITVQVWKQYHTLILLFEIYLYYNNNNKMSVNTRIQECLVQWEPGESADIVKVSRSCARSFVRTTKSIASMKKGAKNRYIEWAIVRWNMCTVHTNSQQCRVY